ncbi:hypothetical protein [Sulfitobacter sp. PS-8MA]|uniref:hypothetical protein n=1 Tax=Sulfitobacter sp. PS-8MA TaxID=3237707 RepID=UPI0034C62F8B
MYMRSDVIHSYTPLTPGELIRKRRLYDPVDIALDARSRPVSYEVLRANITKVRYCRDFGRIEACVAVAYAHHPSSPPRTAYLLTSVPLRRAGQPQDLRKRLIQTAIALSIRFDQQEREGALKVA